MERFGFALAFLLIGFSLGWMLKPSRDIQVGTPASKFERVTLSSSSKTSNDEFINAKPAEKRHEDQSVDKTFLNQLELNEKEQLSALENFNRLLAVKRYREAVDFYQDVERNDLSLTPALKQALLTYLKAKLSSSEFEDFSDIAEYWLNAYYNDIDVLLKLAEYNTRQSFFGEAINLYQLIYSFAANNSDYEKIDFEFSRFVRSRDARLLENEAWYELQAFYESIEQADIAAAANLFRLAEVYLHNGYIEDARSIVERLLGAKRFEIQARNLLADIESGEHEERVFREIEHKTIALQRLNNHFIATISIQNSEPLKLLLDTGASITTISESTFINKLDRIRYTNAQARLFNTANGVARGKVVLVPSVLFGGYEFQELEIAVLPGALSDQVDGLLGMNILSQFRFRIDQEHAQLILEKK